MTNRKIVFILSLGHTGSTLVDYVLSSHEDSFGLGELYSAGKRRFRKNALCSVHGDSCQFWDDASVLRTKKNVKATRLKFFMDYFGLDNSKKRTFDYLFDKTKAQVLVDSSKNIQWISSSLRQLKGSHIDASVVYLKRAPYGLIASWYRKYPERGFDYCVDRLSKETIEYDSYFESIQVSKKAVYYEELTNDPIKGFTELFEFLGLSFNPTYLNFFTFNHHQIGGNSGTASIISNYQGLNVAAKNEYYKDHKVEIKQDSRWKNELSNEQLSTIRLKFADIHDFCHNTSL